MIVLRCVARWIYAFHAYVSLMAKATGMLLPYSGDNIPVTVTFRSGKDSTAFHFDRVFHFPDKGDITFHSRMESIGNNEMIEFMRFGIGWKLAYHWDGKKITLSHRGYVWHVLGRRIPLPLTWVIGAGYAAETPISESRFSMWTYAKHPLMGKTFGYAGEFEIVDTN